VGKLSIVGFGPGDAGSMTEHCKKRLEEADVIVGYTGYTALLKPVFPHKAYHGTGMTREVERCRAAIEYVKSGKAVCAVSSGDAGVYGMAGLIFELLEDTSNPGIEVEVIPGVTAATGGAALLGAPLGHDFAVISLSDLLTKWEVIEKRLRAAAEGDFAICLYNPGSHKRAGHLRRACDILLETMPGERPCGVARNIGRKGQTCFLLALKDLKEFNAVMTDTVFIGNAQTKNICGRMVTPRGYANE
jgi:precorrin-3B C17-methyltransferase